MPPKASGGGKKTKAAKSVTNKRRRGFVDVDLRVSKKQERKDDEKFVKAKFGNFEPAKRGGGGTRMAATPMIPKIQTRTRTRRKRWAQSRLARGRTCSRTSPPG